MKQSQKLYNHAQLVIPGGVNSPVRAFRSVGGTPLFIKRGRGAQVWDADGNLYVDYVGSWGPLIAGHAHPDVVKAVQQTAERGLSFGAPTESELEMASLLLKLVPSMEQVRLVSSGTEATMSAIRTARGFTGRSKIVKFEGCYHGHADALLVKAGSGALTSGTRATSTRRRGHCWHSSPPRRRSCSSLIATPSRCRSVRTRRRRLPGRWPTCRSCRFWATQMHACRR